MWGPYKVRGWWGEFEIKKEGMFIWHLRVVPRSASRNIRGQVSKCLKQGRIYI